MLHFKNNGIHVTLSLASLHGILSLKTINKNYIKAIIFCPEKFDRLIYNCYKIELLISVPWNI